MKLSELLKTKYPIIQAPMAGVQNWELACAVSKAGGLGSIPCGMLSPEKAEEELKQFRSHSSDAVNLNFFCHAMPEISEQVLNTWMKLLAPFYREAGIPESLSGGASRMPFSHAMADAVEPLVPDVVSFHFGLPDKELLERVKGWGSTVISSATTLEEGEWLQAQGADAVIAQGLEAGGHRGMFLTEDLGTQLGTTNLVSLLAENLSIPVIAAGGIATEFDIKKMLASGAQGVQLGTSYLLCDEARTSQIHREAIQKGEQVTAVTNIFSGRPARGISNRIMEELGYMSDVAPAFPYATAGVAPLRSYAEANGLGDFSPLWSGENRSGCKAVSAEVLTKELAEAFKTDSNNQNK